MDLAVELFCNIAVCKAGPICSFLGGGKHNSWNTGPVSSSQTHGAGFAARVQGSFWHMRVSQHLSGHPYGRYLGVGGRVALLLCPVASPGNNTAIVNHHSAKGCATIADRIHGQLNCLLEIGFVTVFGLGVAHVGPFLVVEYYSRLASEADCPCYLYD